MSWTVKEVLREAAVIDFESFQSRDGTGKKPVPVGVATWVPGQRPQYQAACHPSGGNTSTWQEMRRTVGEIYDSGRPLLFHGAKFDVGEALEHLELPAPDWERIHDTSPMLFLSDPRAPTFRLKASAERLLGEAPEERDAVEAWLLEHQPLKSAGVTMSKSKESDHYVGKYIAWAPVPLVTKYAIGDLTRCKGLAKKVLPDLEARGMLEAYDRERRLLPVIMEMEAQGMRVATDRLRRDVLKYNRVLVSIDAWLRKRLRAPNLNCDSPDELGAAMVHARVARLNRTKSGKYEVNKEALLAGVTNPHVLTMLQYRAKLKTALRTFMEPWLAQAELSGGIIFTTWNTIRTDRGKGLAGARTGRMSSTPNFQNLMKPIDLAELLAELDLPLPLPELPNVRSYIVPWDEDEVLIDRDYSQQEPRLLAHFENGLLMHAYQEDPWLDVHDHATETINTQLHAKWKRKPVKNTFLGIIYGQGVGLLAERSRISVDQATLLKQTLLAILPGLGALYKDMKARARADEAIHTWGGREYYCEAPRLIDGRLWTYDYKLLNVLIQGSAADVTKEAMIRYFAMKDKRTRVYLQAHDELLASTPRRYVAEDMERMRAAMESIECDVLMLTEGAISAKSWGELKDYDKKGVVKLKEYRAAAARARAETERRLKLAA